MFLKKKPTTEEAPKANVEKLPKPTSIPELVGRYLIVEQKQNPDWVWTLKGAVRPVDKNIFHCRVFVENRTTAAGVTVKDWTSLDIHPELILWEGYFDKRENTVQMGKFIESSNSR